MGSHRSRVVINAIPFSTQVAKRGAKNILARDRARANKFLAGLHPHGPAAAHEAKKRRGQETLPTQPNGGAGSAAGGDSIDVTDSGALSRFRRIYMDFD